MITFSNVVAGYVVAWLNLSELLADLEASIFRQAAAGIEVAALGWVSWARQVTFQ